MLSVCTAFHDALYVVPNHGSRWLSPALDVTASVRVGVGMRKLEGGCSWLLRLTPELSAGLNRPAAAATRVSLICGSSRSAFRSVLCSSAIRTASSTVSRSVDADPGVCAQSGPAVSVIESRAREILVRIFIPAKEPATESRA